MLVLRRLYGAPELYQLLATFALVLVIKDAALWAWGPEDLLGPKAPGLSGAVTLLGRRFPTYDLFSIAVGPLVLGALWLLLTRTRWGSAGARRDAGPRDGRRARRQPAVALHVGVRTRHLSRRARRRAADAARARQPEPRPRADRRGFRRRRRRWHGLGVRRVRRRGADRDGQGVLHRRRLDRPVRHAVSAQQADPRRRVPRDGGRAGLAAVGPVRQAAGCRARRGRARDAAAAAAGHLEALGLRRARRAAAGAAAAGSRRRTSSC